MRTITLEIGELEAGLDAFRKSWKSGHAEPEARITFSTPELLLKVMTGKRWELLKAIAGKEPLSVRGVAALVGRDIKAVHGDLQALLSAGIVQRVNEGVVFPYDNVHVDFMLKAA